MRSEYTMSPRGVNVKTRAASARPAAGAALDPRREGVTLGLVVAAVIWMWIAAVDAVIGEPFRSFAMLGGVAIFTIGHVLLNVLYGVVIVSVIHRAERAPSVIIGLLFGVVMIEIAFAMITIILSNVGMGELAWVRIFGGSLVGGVTAFEMLRRRHPLAVQLHRAEAEV